MYLLQASLAVTALQIHKLTTTRFDACETHMSIGRLFAGTSTLLQSVNGVRVDLVSTLSRKRVIGLYFTASWCGPCRSFTPELIAFYKRLKATALDDFEIVLVSSDRTQATFNAYYASMPWLALAFDDMEVGANLSDKFRVSGIPALVLVNSDGVLGSIRGRDLVSHSPTLFPWGIKNDDEHAISIKDTASASASTSASAPTPTLIKHAATFKPTSAVYSQLPEL
jgi:nucleoredoxin